MQKTYQKNNKNWYPTWAKTGPQMGSQSGAKIAQNDVLGSTPHKGGSQAASRPPSRSILKVFWHDLRTNFDRCSNTFEVMSRCVVVSNLLQTHTFKITCHMVSDKTCARHSTNNHTAIKANSCEPTCPPKNRALAGRGAGGSGRSPWINQTSGFASNSKSDTGCIYGFMPNSES